MDSMEVAPAEISQGATSLEVEDMDEETEMLYAQAVAQSIEDDEGDRGDEDDDDNGEDCEMETAEAASVKPPTKNDMVGARGHDVPAAPAASSCKAVAKSTAPPTAKRVVPCVASTMAPVGLGDLSREAPEKDARDDGDNHVTGWSKLTSVEDLQLKEGTCSLFDAPSSLKDKKKWNVEVAKLLPFMQDLYAIISTSTQVTNQQIKSHITSMSKKVNDKKLDKRVGWEGKLNSLSARCGALKAIMENCRDLRALCLVTWMEIRQSPDYSSQSSPSVQSIQQNLSWKQAN